MNYQPKPIETAGVELSPELVQLTERLAENAHDLWRNRLSGLSEARQENLGLFAADRSEERSETI